MSLYSDKIDNIIESLQSKEIEDIIPEKKISIHLNSHSREFKNIQFRSHKYKNSQVKKQEKETVVKEKDVKNILDEDISNVYNRPWNKLENGFKKNRINIFIDKESKDKLLNQQQKENLKSMLYSAIDNKDLNKKNDVEYNIEEGEIDKINILEYNETSSLYFLNIKEKPKTKNKKSDDKKENNLLLSLKKKNRK